MSYTEGNSVAGSYQRDYPDMGLEDPDAISELDKIVKKPKIVLMGKEKAGKTAIRKVVFQKMPQNEAKFAESTTSVEIEDVSSSAFIQLKLWDIPGSDFIKGKIDQSTLSDCGALVLVIDAQEDYSGVLEKMSEFIMKAHRFSPEVHVEVFIHKVENQTDEQKFEVQREIHKRISDYLKDSDDDKAQERVGVYLTSIFDHSIFEAFSKVIQKLIPELATLENILNMFEQNTQVEKCFLFDVPTKIYVATDQFPVDMAQYELCCDMMDMVLDTSFIYSTGDKEIFDSQSYSVIELDNGDNLYLQQIDHSLALVCIIRKEHFSNPGLVDYNVHCVKDAVQKLIQYLQPQKKPENGSSLLNGYRDEIENE